ncbi:Sif2p KNAG_0J02560 [Huiozyma naganishii CBS 8797]|uniref:Anaphase-promoting complex subunit 4-like WD40 domain-containing protein n=1 Tax=Huiozyma naganishii (strain ATCC MYA-139 / BCRC 22969 / CBS 8797 / KCTC 17520 / NBRC 10181 / NCYC 3082 / Yp74L-3) TaxID=1071383 RepID=J7RBR4_HUIN7|nr:hypothetical protein KNAG_0J02560 [Kazachstania naganishii CBS 8797]CCK72335.1 hypothetical protein KNAG_0J02560 [Kazachstania naganishii CBS 8797]
MSVTSEELNYLVWRYLQETGNELSAAAMQEETRVLEFETLYKRHIPMGTLVNMVQKGILFCESELLVAAAAAPGDNPPRFKEDFNLVNALKLDSGKIPEIAAVGRFALEGDELSSAETEGESKEPVLPAMTSAPEFVPTLREVCKLDAAVVCHWNPRDPLVLAIGGRDSLARIVRFTTAQCNEVAETHDLSHPFAVNVTTTNQVTCMAWSHEGQQLASAVENGEVRLWDASSGSLQNVLSLHRCAVVAMKWSSDSRHLLTLDTENVTVLWNAASGTVVQHFEGSSQCGVDIEWVDRDKFVVPGPQGQLVVHETAQSAPVGKLVGPQGTVSNLSFNGDTKLLASSSDDGNGDSGEQYAIRVWHGASSNCSHCFYGHSQSVVSLEWIDDDKLISSALDGSLRVWSLRSGRLVGLANSEGVPILVGRLSRDKRAYTIGLMDGQINVYDVHRFLIRLQSQETTEESLPLVIPLCGNHQAAGRDHCNVLDLSWSSSDECVAMTYSEGPSTVVSARSDKGISN